MKNCLIIASFLILIFVTSAFAADHVNVTVGVIGDSYSESYKYFPPHRSKARNWVEMLNGIRSVNFGALQSSEFHKGAKRFAFNWSEDGDTSGDVLSEGLIDGLSIQVANGDIDAVVIFIGGNDLIDSLLTGDTAGGAKTLFANVQTMVSKLVVARSDIQIFLCTLPSPKLLPLFSNAASEFEEKLSAGAASYNGDLKSYVATLPNLHLIDLDKASHKITDSKQYIVDGHVVSKTSLGDSPRHLFLKDGIHIGTLAQGVVANQVAKALSTTIGARIKTIGQRELYHFALRASLYE